MSIASKSKSGGAKNRRKSSSGGVLGGLGASWGAVPRFWYVFCKTLGRTWAHHGPSWSQVDNKLQPRRAMISAGPGKPLIPPRLLHPMGTYLGSATLYNIIFLFQERNYSGEAQGKVGEESDVLCFKKREKQKRSKRIQRACI